VKINFDNYLGSKPFLYGRKLLKDLGTKSHYVDEYDAIGFFGYEVKKIKQIDYPEYADTIGELFDDRAVAVKISEKNLILISDKLPPKRERSTIFHEAGHESIPWHPHFNHSLREKDIDPITQIKIEREAFHASSEVWFPLKHFINDLLSLPLSFKAINNLAERYNGSFEATCIRYALTNPNILAIVVVKENIPLEYQIIPPDHNNRLPLFPDIPTDKRIKLIPPAPLRVQYCSRSYRFPRFIKSGTEIEQGNIIYDCWVKKMNIKREIPSSVFGSSTPFKYQAECLYHYGRIFVLLSIPDKQMSFFAGLN